MIFVVAWPVVLMQKNIAYQKDVIVSSYDFVFNKEGAFKCQKSKTSFCVSLCLSIRPSAKLSVWPTH